MRRNLKDQHAKKKRIPDAQFSVSEPTELMLFLIDKLPQKNRRVIKALLRDKQVMVDELTVSQFNHPLNAGQIVRVNFEKVAELPQFRGLKVLYEDDFLIVVEKEVGVLSVATDKQKQNTAYSILNDYIKSENPAGNIYVVHRLDRETSGVMMFAKSKEAQLLLQESWNDTIIERTYLAVVEGTPSPAKDRIVSYLVESKALIVYSTQNENIGRQAITNYEVIRSNNKFAMLQLNLETGRKNQIRVHMQDIEHPIVGDIKYGSNQNPINRLGLHAWVLSFEHPFLKKQFRFETVIPAEFTNLFYEKK